MAAETSSSSKKDRKTKKVKATRTIEEVEGAPDAKKSREECKTTAATKDSLGSYSSGGLSSLFGKEAVAVNDSPLVIVGEKTITKKVKSKSAKSADDAEQKIDSPTEEGDSTEQKNIHANRSAQRVNRKKGQGGMTVEEKKLTVFVGNVPVTTTPADIKKLFSKYGQIDSVRQRGLIPVKETVTKRIAYLKGEVHEKQDSVFYYVKFKTELSASNALELNGSDMDDHKIRVDTCEGRKDYDKNLTVYLGNLPFDTTEALLAKFFEESVGPVSSSRIVRDPKTGMGKGFGFVTFKESSHVDLALGMTGLEFHKRELRITKLMKKAKLEKVRIAQKKTPSARSKSKQPSKIDNFKFSTRKDRSDDQNARRGLKKSAQKAIKKKFAQKKGKSLMQ